MSVRHILVPYDRYQSLLETEKNHLLPSKDRTGETIGEVAEKNQPGAEIESPQSPSLTSALEEGVNTQHVTSESPGEQVAQKQPQQRGAGEEEEEEEEEEKEEEERPKRPPGVPAVRWLSWT